MKSNCNKCMYKEVCKYKDNINAEDMLAKIQADYPFVANLDFSCKFFEKKEKAVATAEPVKQTVKTDEPVKKEAEKEVKAEPVKEAKEEKPVDDKEEEKTADTTEVSSFEDIRVIDFGLGDDTTSELIRMGGKEMRIKDLKGFANRMSPKCKAEVNAKLQAFHRSI